MIRFVSRWFIFLTLWAGVALGAEGNDPEEESRRKRELELAELDSQRKGVEHWITIIGVLGAGLGFGWGLYQYRKADLWKRAEFLAAKMKEFVDDPDVQLVLTMIDWEVRRINLFRSKDEVESEYPVVYRQLQVSALRPHPLRWNDSAETDASVGEMSGDPSSEESRDVKNRFSREEARIRDLYDRFLNYLETFASYVTSNLIDKSDLDPYLRYWIDDIAEYTELADDADWTCALFAYIEFYGYSGIQGLFLHHGYDISTSGGLFQKQSLKMTDPALAQKLRAVCEERKKKRETQLASR